jgi:hypothetical protein
MGRRAPTGADTAQLREAVRALSWQHARSLSGLQDGDPPRSPFDETALDEAGQRAAVLAHLAALHDVRQLADGLINVTVTAAGETGAAAPAIGTALGGITGSAVRKKYPSAVDSRPGPNRPARAETGRAEWRVDWDRPADRDWGIRVRVRLRRDIPTQKTGRFGVAGQELTMMMSGHAGAPVELDCWTTDEPVGQELLVYVDDAQVLDVLAETSPWRDQGAELVTEPMRAQEPA